MPASLSGVAGSKERSRQEWELNKASSARGRLLKLSYEVLTVVAPSSVQPERDFNVVRDILGDESRSMLPGTLVDIFIMRSGFKRSEV